MTEIRAIRPWTHVHVGTQQTEFFIDVHRDGIVEPDQWDFGTNKGMWERVVEAMKASLKPG